MSDLVTWLRAQLDEDERVARAAAEQDWSRALSYAGDLTEHVDMHNPTRVLAEVEAKRRIILSIGDYEAKIDGEWGCCHDAEAILAGQCPATVVDEIPALRLLALPYADQPGYDESWRP